MNEKQAKYTADADMADGSDDAAFKQKIDDNRTTYGRAVPGGIQYELHNGAMITTIALSFEGLAAMVAIARRIDELQTNNKNNKDTK